MPGVAVFFDIMALAGLILSLVQLQQNRRWGVSIVSPILGIIGNLIYPIEPAIGIVSMVILIIGSVFGFINKVVPTDKPLARVWYKTWWIDLLIALSVIFIGARMSSDSTNDSSSSKPSSQIKSASKATNSSSKSSTTKNDNSLIHFNGDKIVTPKGTVQVIKEATGDTTDGKNAAIFMYKITNTSNRPMTPEQILEGNQINVYTKTNNARTPADSATPEDFNYIMNNDSDNSSNISDALSNDSDNWGKTKIEPGQSIEMSDGNVWKYNDPNTTLEISVGDSIQDVDGSQINKSDNSFTIPDNIEKLNISQWNGQN